jgi:hypothetical protein
VQHDQWKSIQEISAEVVISVGSVHDILHKDLNTFVSNWLQECQLLVKIMHSVMVALEHPPHMLLERAAVS